MVTRIFKFLNVWYTSFDRRLLHSGLNKDRTGYSSAIIRKCLGMHSRLD